MNWINETGEKDYMALSDTFTTLGNTIINLVTKKITKALSDLTLYLGVYGGRATYTVKYINLISDPITTTATVTTTVTDMETRTKYVFDDYISYNTDSTLVFISDFNIGALFTPGGFCTKRNL